MGPDHLPDECHDTGVLALLLDGGDDHIPFAAITVVDNVKFLGREVALVGGGKQAPRNSSLLCNSITA